MEASEQRTLAAEIAKLLEPTILDKVETTIANKTRDIVNATSESIKRSLGDTLVNETAKKLKLEKKQEFKSKSHEIQHEFNESIEQVLRNAKISIQAKDVESANKILDEGMKIIKKRQKLIKIADREENGWEVVKCYVSDDLASDSDDEKSLQKARKEAALICRKKNLNKSNKRSLTKNYLHHRNSERFNEYNSTTDRHGKDKNFRNETFHNTRQGTNSSTNLFRTCYLCGKPGHIQFNCPIRRTKFNN